MISYRLTKIRLLSNIIFCCRSVKSLWSEIHVAGWYLNMYLNEHIDNTINELASMICNDWYNSELLSPPSAAGLPGCPCTREQADVDDRFDDDPACANGEGCRFHPGAYHCIRSVSPRLENRSQFY